MRYYTTGYVCVRSETVRQFNLAHGTRKTKSNGKTKLESLPASLAGTPVRTNKRTDRSKHNAAATHQMGRRTYKRINTE